jgi:hypothetical protein
MISCNRKVKINTWNRLLYANNRRFQEADCTAEKVVFQDLLQVWSKESHRSYQMQKVQRITVKIAE